MLAPVAVIRSTGGSGSTCTVRGPEHALVLWRRHGTGRLIASGANQALAFSRKVTSAERRRHAYLRLAPRCDAGIYWQGPGGGGRWGMFLQLTRRPHPSTPTNPFSHEGGCSECSASDSPSTLSTITFYSWTNTPAQANLAYHRPQKCTLSRVKRPPLLSTGHRTLAPQPPAASDCQALRCQLLLSVCQRSDSKHTFDIPVS